jgi:type III restriction/modification enzyme restriction subunit
MSCPISQSILNDKSTAIVDKILTDVVRHDDLIPIGYSAKQPLLQIDPKLFHGLDDRLLQNQLEVIKEIKTNSVLLHLPTGFGKTIIGILLAMSAKGKTLILVPRKIIYDQWVERITSHSTQLNSESAHGLDVYMQISFAKKIPLTRYTCVIVDECHLNTRLVFTQILPYIHTTYLFGLSATPLTNNFHYEHFFKQTVFRHQTRHFIVTPIFLHFKPKIYFCFYQGKKVLNYSKILQSLTGNMERLEWICDNIAKILGAQLGTVKSLIITKNVNTVNFLTKKLSELTTVDTLFGKKDKFDENANILVGTYQKMGVGFDSNIYKNLFIIDNLKDIIQAEGRLRNSNFHLYDFIDDHFLFLSHWKTRSCWYEKRGAVILNQS